MRLLALLAVGLFAGGLIAADDKKKDEEVILGTWKTEKMDDGSGKEYPAEELAKMRLTFEKSGKVITRMGTREAKADYKMDSSAKPKSMDFDDGVMPKLGLYELDGDTLKVCVGTNRPKELKADAKAGNVVMVLKRVKDEKKDK